MIEFVFTTIIGPVLSYLTEIAKRQYGRDGKKTILILSFLIATGLYVGNRIWGEATIQYWIQQLLYIAGVGMSYYNFFIKKQTPEN